MTPDPRQRSPAPRLVAFHSGECPVTQNFLRTEDGRGMWRDRSDSKMPKGSETPADDRLAQ